MCIIIYHRFHFGMEKNSREVLPVQIVFVSEEFFLVQTSRVLDSQFILCVLVTSCQELRVRLRIPSSHLEVIYNKVNTYTTLVSLVAIITFIPSKF